MLSGCMYCMSVDQLTESDNTGWYGLCTVHADVGMWRGILGRRREGYMHRLFQYRSVFRGWGFVSYATTEIKRPTSTGIATVDYIDAQNICTEIWN